MTRELAGALETDPRLASWVPVATYRFQLQPVTAPVMAKGVEDTAFYRYNRLVSLNEVGGDPERFGLPVAEFHRSCLARQETWPAGLSTTSIYDTKRSKDVRARIHIVAEIPGERQAGVVRRHRRNLAELFQAGEHVPSTVEG